MEKTMSKDDVLKYCIISAEAGHDDAQCTVGNAYHYGELGAEVDYSKAIDWYEKSMSQGNAEAEYELGIMNLRGEGTEACSTTAFQLFVRSANKGNYNATTMMGQMYYLGVGVKQDLLNAALCFKAASDNGNSTAKFNLAFMYMMGTMVPQDKAKAVDFLTESALLGNTNALAMLVALYRVGSDTWGVTKDEKKAAIWNELLQSRKETTKPEQTRQYNNASIK